MDKAITSLGSPELHERHSVMIEGGKYPRSKVMDQFIFDRYLMQGEINLVQHRAAESLLSMAAKANMWARGANMEGVYTGSGKSKVPFGVVPFGNALKLIREDCGEVHCLVTRAVIIDNKDVRKHNGLMLFKDAMDYVNDHMIHFHKNPLK